MPNFSRLLNASARITFWTLHVRANFVFRLFYVSLSFRVQSAKTTCVRIAIFIFSEKLQNIFEKWFKKKTWHFHTKIAHIEKILPCENSRPSSLPARVARKKKNSQTPFCCLCVNLPTVKIWGVIGQIPYEFELSASTEKIDLRKQR